VDFPDFASSPETFDEKMELDCKRPWCGPCWAGRVLGTLQARNGSGQVRFSEALPETEILETRISEDEVVARSFEFTYRKKGKIEAKKIAIQYIESDSGPYKIAPVPPKDFHENQQIEPADPADYASLGG
jgi:hypothetical protein